MNADVAAEIEAVFALPRDRAQPTAGLGPDSGPVQGGHTAASIAARTACLELERSNVVATSFVPVARSTKLAATDDFVCTEIAGIPVIVTRQEAGHVSAFVNVCLHRAAVIVREETGNAASHVCPYHGFTYSSDGTLRGMPESDSFRSPDWSSDWSSGAEASANAQLRQLDVAEAYGWVWVRAACDTEPAEDARAALDAFLGDALVDELQRWPLTGCVPVAERRIDCDFDWKIGVEAFLEPLHVPSVHARSAHPMVDIRGMAARRFGRHSRMALPFRLKNAFEPTGFLGADAASAGVPVFSELAPVQRQAHFAYFVYPYTIFLLFPNHALTMRFEPRAVGTCSYVVELLAEPPQSDAAAAWLASLVPGCDRLVDEDLANLPWIEKGVRSGESAPFGLSSFERRIGWFRASLAQDCGAGLL